MAQRKSVDNLRGEQGTLVAVDEAIVGTRPDQFACFVCLTDATITAITMGKELGDVADYYGITYPQGFVFYGPITNITVTGTIQLHNFIDPNMAAAIGNM